MTTKKYRSPLRLLNELGIYEPKDIDIEAIAQYCDATIVYEPLDGCEARILGYNDRAIITVNSKSIRPRQRFSGAHELGHWMCDRQRIASFSCDARDYNTEWYEENPEVRANKYAEELLMPESTFRRDSKKIEIIFDSVKALAERYDTSLTATARRLVALGSFPAMIVCNEAKKGRWTWFKRSPDIPKKIWPRDRPGRDTIAFDLLQGLETRSFPTMVPADNWIEHPDSCRYSIHEDSTLIGDGVVLSLLWWKDESQLADLL